MSEQGTIESFDPNKAIPSGLILHEQLPDEPETLFFLIGAVQGGLQQQLLNGGGIGAPVLFDRDPGTNEATTVIASGAQGTALLPSKARRSARKSPL